MSARTLCAALVALALAACAGPAPKKHTTVKKTQKSSQTTTAKKAPAKAPAKTAQKAPAKTGAKPATTTAKAPAPTAKSPTPTAAAPKPKPQSPTPTAAPPAPAAAPPTSVATAPPAQPSAPVAARTPQARYAQALELLKANQWADAEPALQQSVRDYPTQSGPRTNLGILYARTNRKPQAQAEFARAVVSNPRNAVAQNWLGVLAREAGDYAKAEQAYRAALAADSQYAPAQLNLAILYDQYLKRPQDALAAYRRYQAIAAGKDTRVAVWIAQLESRGKAGATP